MAMVEPYYFEPNRVPDKNQTSEDDSDASERLRSLNRSTAFVVNSENRQESASRIEQPESENKVYGIYFMNFVLFCPFNMHATRHHLRIYEIETSSQDYRWESSLARI